VFGNHAKAAGWLQSAHPALSGETPLQVLDKGRFEIVDDLLSRIEHGIPS
jgi:uncharacterized protein (DUF2384 family)